VRRCAIVREIVDLSGKARPKSQGDKDLSPQERAEHILRRLYECWRGDLPDSPTLREDFQWIEKVRIELAPKFKSVTISEMRKQSKDLLDGATSFRETLERNRAGLLGLCATESYGGDPPEVRAAKLAKVDQEIAEARRKEKEYREAYLRTTGWGNTGGCRTAYQMIVTSPLDELADLAAAKFYQRRGAINAGLDGPFYAFASLLLEHVTDTQTKATGFAGACRKAVRKIKSRQECGSDASE
jgi:hypothetical protein